MKLVLLGAPGAGKGTQAEWISEKLQIPSISTGNMIRAAMKADTPLGRMAKDIVEKGDLLPDDVILDIVEERLSQADCQAGYILDGVPRTIPQAEGLEAKGVQLDAALLIDVSDGEIEHRMTGRRTCPDCGESYHVTANPPKQAGVCDRCGATLTIRKDDAPETVKERLRVYHQETEPIIRFYEERGLLRRVEGQEDLRDTTKLVAEALGIHL